MTRICLCTTTINVPTALAQWDCQFMEDDCIIVAGDLTTPHDEVTDFLAELETSTLYVHPSGQTKWHSSDAIGWNKIQRRNIALLEAISANPDVIIMIDDDNLPYDTGYVHLAYNAVTRGVRRHCVHLGLESAHGRFVNPCMMHYDNVRHRGIPREFTNSELNDAIAVSIGQTNVVVFESMWYGHPDIDAIDRIHNNNYVRPIQNYGTLIPALGAWAPINSQATTYQSGAAPLMCVWPYIGRADDIWASYAARKVLDQFNCHVAYGSPTVMQDRNINGHDGFRSHLKDLKGELHMYEQFTEYIKFLREITIPEKACESIIDAMEFVYDALTCCDVIPDELKEFLITWPKDVRMAMNT